VRRASGWVVIRYHGDRHALATRVDVFDPKPLAELHRQGCLAVREARLKLNAPSVPHGGDDAFSVAKRNDRLCFTHDQRLERSAGLALKAKQEIPDRPN